MSLSHFNQEFSYKLATDVGNLIGFIYLCSDMVLNFVAEGPINFFSSLKGLVDCAFVITFIVILSIEPNGFFRSTLQIAVTVRWALPLSEFSKMRRNSALFVLLNVVKTSLVHLINMWVTCPSIHQMPDF